LKVLKIVLIKILKGGCKTQNREALVSISSVNIDDFRDAVEEATRAINLKDFN
jgi:hypothetical protein